jgi:hypothetical protein
MDPTGAPPSHPDPPLTIRPRAVILAALLMPPTAFWIVQSEMVRYTFATLAAPFYNAIYLLCLVLLANFLVSLRWPRAALNRAELLLVYVTVSVVSGVISSCILGVLVSNMGYARWFATPENGWQTNLLPLLPRWLTVTEPRALKDFYVGSSTLYAVAHLRAWALPVLVWSAMGLGIALALASLANLVSRQWMERERLTFPIVELPYQMTAPGGSFFRSRAMWIGLLLAGGITAYNGLAHIIPALPMVPIKRRYFSFATPPWNSAGSIVVSFYFFAIALGFIMPVDLALSSVAFHVITLIERVTSASCGWGAEGRGVPFIGDQALGAFLAVFLLATRGFWRPLLRRHRESPGRLRLRPAREHAAACAFIVPFCALVLIAVGAGLRPYVAVYFFVVYFINALVVSRIRAEFGFPVNDLHANAAGPTNSLVRVFGSRFLDRRTLSVLTLFHWLNRDTRSHPMPHALEGLKLGALTSSSRSMWKWIVVFFCLAAPVGFWAYLHVYYNLGAGSGRVERWVLGFGRENYVALEGWLRAPTGFDSGRATAVAAGCAFSLAMSAFRARFTWFPLHPIAYAVAGGWGMYNLWLPILIGGSAKLVVTRYSGLRGYRRLLPFFMGLMLGEYLIGCTWSLWGILVGVRAYDFFP